MKFDFLKSPEDLLNKFQYIYTRLDKLLEQQRYTLELLIAMDKALKTERHLQEQANEYYASHNSDSDYNEKPPEELPEGQTSL